jgi:nitroreductase
MEKKMTVKYDSKILETEFLKLARSRISVRKFSEDKVEREKILTCIEAARIAPSAENVQPWRFIVLDNSDTIDMFGSAAFSGIYRYSHWAVKAPVIICISAELDILANRIGKEIQGTSYYLIDIGIAGEQLVLQAQELGLGTCWIGWFNARKASKILDLPRRWKVVSLIAMGYPAYKSNKVRDRKSLEEIIYFNGFKNKLKLI